MPQNTTLPDIKTIESSRKWHHIDADGQILGRMATKIAVLLIGKHKRDYSPHIDGGDFVVVTNASKIRLTGRKPETKFYFRHSGYADGAKTVSFARQMALNPSKVVSLAVKRMIDDNRLRDRRLKRLRIFNGPESPFKQGKKTEKAAAQAKG